MIQAPELDYETIFATAKELFGLTSWFGEDYFRALSRRFVNRLILQDPKSIRNLTGRSAIFIANHQVQIESVLFPSLAQALWKRPIVAIADADHLTGWVGALDRLISSYPGMPTQKSVVYFNQKDRGTMLDILEGLRADIAENGICLFLHAEGRLGHTCRQPVRRLSSVSVDLALTSNLPVVPVKFTGGLPVTPLPGTLDFPVGYARQDYHIGSPLYPGDLKALPYAQRRQHIIRQINQLGPPLDKENPAQPDRDFTSKVDQWQRQAGTGQTRSVLYQCLATLPPPTTGDIQAVLESAQGMSTAKRDKANHRWIQRMADWLMAR